MKARFRLFSQLREKYYCLIYFVWDKVDNMSKGDPIYIRPMQEGHFRMSVN